MDVKTKRIRSIKLCSVEKCGKSSELVRGLCYSHYRLWKVYGDINPNVIQTCLREYCCNLFSHTPHNGKSQKFCGPTCRRYQNNFDWRTNNPQEYKEDSKKGGFRRYCITEDDYNLLLAQQNKCCAVCGTNEPGGPGRFHIDHDHACCSGNKSCGKCIRGLLCSSCNIAAGLLQDDPRIILSLLEYVEKSKR